MPRPGLTEFFEANRVIRNPRYQPVLLRSSRQVAPFLAWLATRLGISPFHVNFFNLLLSLAACAMFALGPPEARIPTAALLIFWQVLDATDGNMARALGIRSNYGGFVDYLAGMYLVGFLHVSIGVGLFRFPEYSMATVLGWVSDASYLPVYSLIIGAYSSLAMIFFRLTARIIEARFGINLKAVEDQADSASRSMEFSLRKSSLKKMARRLIKNVESIGGLQLVLLLFAAIVGCLEIFLAFYLLVSVSVLATFTVKALIDLKDQHNYL